jgi:hypothetical protein
MRVFENSVVRKIIGPKKEEGTGDWSKCIMRRFITLLILADGRGMGSSGSAEAQVTGFCEQSNQLLGSINCGTVLCGDI